MLSQHLAKGRRVGIDGRLDWSSWEADGQKRSKVEVVAFQVQFLDSRGEGGGEQGSTSRPPTSSRPGRLRAGRRLRGRRRHSVLEKRSERRMARESNKRQRRTSPSSGPTRRKSCYFCREKIDEVDYKNYNQLRRYISEKGKIRSRRITGACRRHQGQIAVAVKRAREVALLPTSSRTT